MKTPEEIKKGLECCNNMADGCMKCPHETEDEFGWHCVVERNIDALAYIQQLEHNWDELFEKAKQLERERDAAVKDMTELMQLLKYCRYCKHLTDDGECTNDFADTNGMPWRCWEWIGVREEEE